MASGSGKEALAITFSVGTAPMLRSLCDVVYAIAITRAWATLLEGGRPATGASTIMKAAQKGPASQLLRGSVTPIDMGVSCFAVCCTAVLCG
jgi:hypothetical protein